MDDACTQYQSSGHSTAIKALKEASHELVEIMSEGLLSPSTAQLLDLCGAIDSAVAADEEASTRVSEHFNARLNGPVPGVSGWYPDFSDFFRLRWWDGTHWTAQVSDAGDVYLSSVESIKKITRSIQQVVTVYIHATVRMDNGNIVEYYRYRRHQHPASGGLMTSLLAKGE